MIARVWRGSVRTTDREAYLASIERTGMAEYGRRPATVARTCRPATSGTGAPRTTTVTHHDVVSGAF